MQISTISPSTFDDGKPVTLTGSGFGASQGQVLIGGVAQNVNTWSDDEITFTTVRGSQSLGACRVDVVATGGGGSSAFFTDGFSSGDLLHTEGGASWAGSNAGSGDAVAVVSGTGNPGYGLRFQFGGGASGEDAWAEQRFDLGAVYSELTVEFDLYVPDGSESWGGAAYAHRADSPNNNKILRLWGVTYNDLEKVGASLWENGGYSETRAEWNTGGGIGAKGAAAQPFITAGDLGTWITVAIYAKAATATTNGTFRIYKNGILVINNTETMNNYDAGGVHGWRYGYLLGWANSGFASTTYLVIDNVKFYAGAI